MSTPSCHNHKIPTQAWFQPLGWWRERGASENALHLAIGMNPEDRLDAEVDGGGYTLWHYWAEGSQAEKRLDSLAGKPSLVDNSYLHRLALNGEHPWHRLMIHGQKSAALAWVDKFGVPDLSLRSQNGDDMLMSACWSGNADLVEWLLSNGAEPTNADENGLTALMVAIHRCPPKTITALIMAGADPEQVDRQRKSALHHAASRAMVDMFPFLEDAGADAEAVDITGVSAQANLERALRNEAVSQEIAQAHWLKRYYSRICF